MRGMWSWVGDWWDWISGLSSDNWQGIGSMGTLIVAVVAALFARSQVLEARAVRLEQSQPHVVVDLQSHSIALELVVKNTGTTTARNVVVTFDPGLESTLVEEGRTKMLSSKLLTKGVASMPPGKEYRVLFEDSVKRYKRNDLPRVYEATVNYTDSRQGKYTEQYTLDFDALYGYNTISVYGIHDAAKALREIKTTLEKWSEFGSGIKVVSRDGDRKDQEEREYFKLMREENRQEQYRESRRNLTEGKD